MAKKKMAKAALKRPARGFVAKRKPAAEPVLVSAVRSLKRQLTQTQAQLLLLTEKVAALEHRDNHLDARLTALDGQTGGGDEFTSRPTVDPSYVAGAKVE